MEAADRSRGEGGDWANVPGGGESSEVTNGGRNAEGVDEQAQSKRAAVKRDLGSRKAGGYTSGGRSEDGDGGIETGKEVEREGYEDDDDGDENDGGWSEAFACHGKGSSC